MKTCLLILHIELSYSFKVIKCLSSTILENSFNCILINVACRVHGNVWYLTVALPYQPGFNRRIYLHLITRATCNHGTRTQIVSRSQTIWLRASAQLNAVQLLPSALHAHPCPFHNPRAHFLNVSRVSSSILMVTRLIGLARVDEIFLT